ncbi:protein RRP6-like 3 isoform X2 [Punica granatum]|uniref:Protein RRP6-like 3 isoform X2 n=1 Tax=Punica granatum TaxID=22663 RepID=A0A6P8D262_PUNGR|nr:protein RRP6-like 3 isoform X2 [Punica granatum]
MESRLKLRALLMAASLAALSLFLASQYRRRRRQKLRSGSCYLRTDSKPQQSFKRVLADNSYAPFKHLKRKDSDDEISSNVHPYEAEIMALLNNPRLEFKNRPDDMDLTMKDAYVWVETVPQLEELADILAKERVFAVDTEQHSLRSYLGFTALMQISTQEEDYLIDTIALHDSMGILRSVFSNPSICKVFHGADNDVLWLQRDFHIYVVNLFDTAKACDVLLKPQRSLAYLLETYCGVATNKLLQREDWRQRPLPEEMVLYARTDAHYLLYIAHCMVAEIRERDDEESFGRDDKLHFVLEACRRSNAICLQLYTKDIEASPGEAAASSLISRHLNGQGSASSDALDTQFQDVIRRLCAWRELMARVHDESLRFVLSDPAILALAEKVPSTLSEIFDTMTQADLNAESLSASFPSPSPVVCSHMDHLGHLFLKKIGDLNDLFPVILQTCLGQNGSCPLTVCNYPLLVNSTMKLTNRVLSRQNGSKSAKQVTRKASRQLFVQKFSCKSPVYHNCRIYANDGRLLCYSDRRKLEWYLRRDLAKVVDDDPPAIMLLFEPKGRPEDEDNDFYIQSKKNICVGCGEGNHYLRYRIIPSCYRMHFPEHLKSHRSHDIVLLCVDCHEVAHAAAEKYKRQVAAEFGVPLFVRNIADSKDVRDPSETSELTVNFEQAGVSPLELRTAAMALIRHGHKMPPKRREELTQVVMRFYGGREITNEDLERALLVGMSSHERKRLEKKRGLSLKRNKAEVIPGAEQKKDDNDTGVLSIAADQLEVGRLDCEKEGAESSFISDEGCGNSLLHCDSVAEEEAPISIENDKNIESNRSEAFNCEDVHAVDIYDDEESRTVQNEVVGIHDSVNGGAPQPKHNPKLSLLGHGPHGKQVVDHILQEYGEDGIREFCQRWRQVFVEAVQPRFLPAGWDIKHSGRRDFGEFSVYNPAKKASSDAART